VFESTLDISEIQVNFDLEESEMRIFSEDETLVGSGSIGFSSPRPTKLSKSLVCREFPLMFSQCRNNFGVRKCRLACEIPKS